MTIRMAALAAAAMFGLATPALAAPAPLTGIWTGFYGYDGQANIVQFQARLSAGGAFAFTGATIENNTFGDANVLFLTANLKGVKNDTTGRVSFAKTYDGTGGQSHTVQYDGAYDSSGACVAGTWKIDGAGGPFRMCTASKPSS